MAEIPAGQQWFWTSEWQAGEREAGAEISEGRTKTFSTIEDMLTYLEQGHEATPTPRPL